MTPTKTKKTVIVGNVHTLTKFQRDLLAYAREHGDKISKKDNAFEITPKPSSDAKTGPL